MEGRKFTRWEMALICWTVGIFGVHRLLMGYKNWWLQLLTLGGLFIWTIIDFFAIVTGKLKPLNDILVQS